MVDPLSVLGAAVGVTSLIIQLTDECVKGYKLYHEAADLPQTHRYLLVRLHIEQQRFLNFAFEAGLLNMDGVVCSTLQVNRSLLLAILAEIKLLFESFAAANGKYEKAVAGSPVNWDDPSYPELDLMSFLCIATSDHTQLERENLASKRAEAAKRVRRLGRSIAQTAKNLRTIVVEPKRLVWAAVDKDAFEQFISKLDGLNTFLVSLLDSSQLQRLQDSMNTAYLEILQLRNDIGDLTSLVKALDPAAETKVGIPAGIETNALSQAVAEQTAIQKKKESYLRDLANIKLQFTKINSLSNSIVAAPDQSKLIDSLLSLDDFDSVEVAPEVGILQHRTRTTYRGRRVWIEWKDIPTTGSVAVDEQVEWRIGLLTDLLRSVKPEGFRAARCLGYIKIKILHTDDATRFGIVFEEPLIHGAESKMITLRGLFERKPYPSLSTRLALCVVLARCVQSFHAVNWLHKALRPDNIIFFSSSDLPSLNEPFLSGFDLSRPSTMDQLTEKPGFDPLKDIYRHPNAQSSQADGNYRKSYDIYSLGILMIEVALWKRIDNIVPLEDLGKAKPPVLREIQPWLLGMPLGTDSRLNTTQSGSCLQQVAFACGDSFHDIVKQCLRMDTVEGPEYFREKETAIALRLQSWTEKEIVKKLDRIASLM